MFQQGKNSQDPNWDVKIIQNEIIYKEDGFPYTMFFKALIYLDWNWNMINSQQNSGQYCQDLS